MSVRPPGEAAAPRANGLLVLSGIVLLGLGSGAAYLQYQRPKMAAEVERLLAEAPSTPEGRLGLWHVYGAPNIHHRLAELARFSADMPWLVTHALETADGGDPEIFGIDCSALPMTLSHVEGLKVVVELPRPRRLGRARPYREQAGRIPVYRAGAEVPDPSGRLRELALFLLEGIPAALARDIEGASLEVRVAGE